jgi:hypothetical protein
LEYNFQIPHFVYCDQSVMIHGSWVALWYFYLKKCDVIWWEGVWWRQNTFRFSRDKIHTHWYLLSLDRSNRSALCWLVSLSTLGWDTTIGVNIKLFVSRQWYKVTSNVWSLTCLFTLEVFCLWFLITANVGVGLIVFWFLCNLY